MNTTVLDAVADSLRDKIAHEHRLAVWYESAMNAALRHLAELRHLLAIAECATTPAPADDDAQDVVH